VRGAHADHVIAFARRHSRAAAIVMVGRQFAPFTQAGREWPVLEGFDAAVDITGYTTPGLAGNELPLAQAFRDFPAAVIEARATSTARPARQRART
jgi:(1->4)-alpha-D-glucan 1-alpha-D-glucosylmutase